jgi:small subunit ribosomal protein S3Ae
MAKGKNKQLSKRGGGRGGKTEKHAFAKKKWYKLQTPPTIGPSVNVGWVPVNKTIGTKLSKDGLLGRVAEVNLADVQDKCSCPWKRVKMQIEEVKSSSCYTSWYGLSMINEKLYTFLRKKMTLIDVVADVKTQDGYILRCLVTTFTSRKQGQLRTNTYAKASQVRAIRKAFVKYLAKVAVTSTISDFAASVIGESMANKLMERGKKIFPLSTVLVRKVKVLKKSKIDVNKLVTETNAKREAGAIGQKGENVAAEAVEAVNAVNAPKEDTA